MAFTALRLLLTIDLVIATLSCVPMLFMPGNIAQTYHLCHTEIMECELITLLSTLFNGRNICMLVAIFAAICTHDATTRRLIAVAIMLWCLYMPAMYLYFGASFMHYAISKITVVMLLLFAVLYATFIYRDYCASLYDTK